jgi:type III pantothenate kinase
MTEHEHEQGRADNRILYLDCGNSRCKYSMGERSGAWQDLEKALSAIDQWQPDLVLIATVSAFGANLLSALEASGRHPVRQMAVENGLYDIRISYPDPSLYGIDRWLTLVATRGWQENVVVVDAGTALTIDALDSTGHHLGGYILPGLTLMRRALVNDTFALPEVNSSQRMTPGHSTADAIANGAVLALGAAVSASVVQFGLDPYRLVWTGGDASLLAAQPLLAGELRKDLVIDGMKILYKDAAYMESLG